MKPGLAAIAMLVLLVGWSLESPGQESVAGQSEQGAGPVLVPDVGSTANPAPPVGNAARGRLVFAQCRTCHYAQAFMGHNNGPNLHRIFGKVAGKQPGFDYYSTTFKTARFVWTPGLMYAWLDNPMAMFPGSSMMSLGVPDPQRRADLIAFLQLASVRDAR